MTNAECRAKQSETDSQRLPEGKQSASMTNVRVLAVNEAWVLTDEANAPARKLYASAGGMEETTMMISFELDVPRINSPA